MNPMLRHVMWAVTIVFWLLILATGGWLKLSRDVRSLMNDEVALAHRGAALQTGFWTAMLLAMAIYFASLAMDDLAARGPAHPHRRHDRRRPHSLRLAAQPGAEPGVALRLDHADEVAHRERYVAEVEAPAGNELRPEIDVAGDLVGAGVVGVGVDGDREIAGLAVVPAFARDEAARRAGRAPAAGRSRTR